jgi:5-methylcytosine-specific restriction enzyme A
MPMTPRRPCATSGCPNLVTRGQHCPIHQAAYERARGTRTQRGYDNRWGRYSRARLARFPFCAWCGRLADVTDHIRSARAAPELFWNKSNHQSLCAECHARKTIADEGGFARESASKGGA